MSVSYRVEIERGGFTAGEWRALVYMDDEVVNCFIGESPSRVSEEVNAAIYWHEARLREDAEALERYSVKA